ncbi:MAG: hypothetical protein H3C31_08475 [Brumimicrobium sp.]|nr:hypothetical protein [Brumimicrobium sp.]MCO5269496.1 hypothetical protein [Brumimicrobium sp.]
MQKWTIIVLGIYIISSLGCQENHKKKKIKEITPPVTEQLIDWGSFNENNLNNISFPIWFSPTLVDSLKIQDIEVSFSNFNQTDTLLSVVDTLPYQKIKFAFDKSGFIEKISISELNMGKVIATHHFLYHKKVDEDGYSIPEVNSKIEYKNKKRNPVSYLSTLEDLQQYRRLVLENRDSTYIAYLDGNRDIYHYFITDSSKWNVTFIDKVLQPEADDIIYFGCPKNFISSFSIQNLVERVMFLEQSYYSNDLIKSQRFYTDGFYTKKDFNYNEDGLITGFTDSLYANDNTFIHAEQADIIYNQLLPKSLSYYSEDDGSSKRLIKVLHFNYSSR